MKILYLIHQFYPEYHTGTEKFVFNQASMMQKFGHKPVVLTYSFYPDAFYDQTHGNLLYKTFSYKGIAVLALRHRSFPADLHDALSDPDVVAAAPSLIGWIDPDIAHVGHSMRMGGLIHALIDGNIPYMMTLTDFFMICPKTNLTTSGGPLCRGPARGDACRNLCPEQPPPYIQSRLASARCLLEQARIITAPSRFLTNTFTREVPGVDAQVVPHGMNYSLMKQRRVVYKKNDTVTFCFAGSLIALKGVLVLIEAFKKVRSVGAALKIYGSGPDDAYERQLRAQAAEDKRIQFCGVFNMEDAGNIFSAADVVVVPSLAYENYPLVLHEALACRTPVIASNAGGMAERMVHGANGFLFDMGDQDHLARILQAVTDDPTVLNRLREGIDRMTSPTVEQEAYLYERIYRQMA